MYATYQGRRILSKKGREYKKTVAALIGGKVKTVLTGEVRVKIDIFRPRKAGDIDSALKSALDSLTGLIYKDDRQITELFAYRFDDRNNARVEIEIIEI